MQRVEIMDVPYEKGRNLFSPRIKWAAGQKCGLHCDFTRCGSDPLAGHVKTSKLWPTTCGVNCDDWSAKGYPVILICIIIKMTPAFSCVTESNAWFEVKILGETCNGLGCVLYAVFNDH